MNDNEYYVGKVENYESRDRSGDGMDEYLRSAESEKSEIDVRSEATKKKHAGRRKLLQLLCSAAMIVVVSGAVYGNVSNNEPLPGCIMNAKTGEGINGVSLAFYKGTSISGAIVATAVTDEEGNFSVALDDGEYTANATAKGYLAEGIHFNVDNSSASLLSGTLLPLVEGDGYTIVLTWGDHPADLDSHMECDINELGLFDYSGYLHVFYSNKNYYTSPDYILCNLDVDDTTCYGPETISLETAGNNPFYYYVYNYSGTDDFYSSEAVVRVYKGSKLLKTFNIPTNENSGRYWNVFAIYKDKIIVNDTVSDSPNLDYAGEKNKKSNIDEY